MKKHLLFTLLLTSLLFPQLREMEVKETTPKGGIPVNRDNPEKAAIFFYTQFDDLSFWSNYGIVDIKGDPSGGKYIVIVEPVRQTIEVRRKGYKTEMLKINSLSPMEVLCYEVLPKKDEGIGGITEMAITVQATPGDAMITLDGVTFLNNVSTRVEIGKHLLKVEKNGYEKYEKEIIVSPDNTLFKVELPLLDLVEVSIDSKPYGAEIFLNEISYGQTKKSFFLYPGEYELKLIRGDYLPFTAKIQVKKVALENNFTFDLIRSSGFVTISSTPEDATIMLNKMIMENGKRVELSPGLYRLEVEKEGFIPYTGSVTVELGKTTVETVNLKARTGTLQFTVNPVETNCVLLRDGKEISRWKGLKLISNLQIGSYTLLASLDGYKPEERSFVIYENQTASVEIKMVQEKYLPQDLASKKLIVSGDQNVKIYGLQQNNESVLVCQYEFPGIEGEEYDVEFYFRRSDDPGFRYSMDNVSGDAGSIKYKKGVKRITINLLDSYIAKHPDLDYFFEIEVKKSGEGFAWYYYAIGTAVLGGTAAILILTSGDKSETAPVTVGAPPIRP